MEISENLTSGYWRSQVLSWLFILHCWQSKQFFSVYRFYDLGHIEANRIFPNGFCSDMLAWVGQSVQVLSRVYAGGVAVKCPITK